LPAIEKHARIAFRRLKREAREEAVAEVVANAMVAYVRLIERGRQDVAFATPLANFAIAQYHDGRRVGAQLNVLDVTSAHCQVRKGVVIERLDCWDREESCWQEVLVEDRTCTPAELAASRIDFVAWLATLSSRDRKIATLLASGCGTSEVAEKVGLSWARISQMRRELKESWEKFHGPHDDEPAEGALSVAA